MLIKYFRVLPTDPRFKELTSNQKLQIFYSFSECPTLEDVQEKARRNPRFPDLSKQELMESPLIENEEEAEWYVEQVKMAQDPEYASKMADTMREKWEKHHAEDKKAE